ncbi:transcription repressor OFP8-like [Zingiber officinale]|uniref:Transcription repressor n=1 Tax=Zingiber officinale TaxID=94328 RepID=A0A8J5BT02_ZINOF|nr:transcription repressor OFP8-like [Zingiber officinale]KAG6466190.1 hypothetical protein ZIOFF_076013 [Zingiber officinale]
MSAQRRRSSSFIGLAGCGCRNSKSVAVSSSSSDAKSTIAAAAAAPAQQRAREATSSGETLTMTSPSTSSYWDPEIKVVESSASTPSVSGLLRQLGELEQDVASWAQCTPPPPQRKRQHKRSFSEGGGRRVEEESVAVVRETKDPLGEFRRSMLQMIVEKEIVDGEELQELLRRLLTLNAPQHHTTILQAFAEIWEEVFAGYEHTPKLLHRATAPRLAAPRRA